MYYKYSCSLFSIRLDTGSLEEKWEGKEDFPPIKGLIYFYLQLKGKKLCYCHFCHTS